MTGSLQELKGHFYCVLNIKDERGKRKQKWISTGLEIKGNKKRAQQILNECLVKYSDKDFHKNKEALLTDCLKKWLKDKKDKVKLNTWEGYQTSIEKHLIPYFEPMKLKVSELTPRQVIDFYDYKFRGGRMDGKKGGVSARTLKLLSFALGQALNKAVIEEIIDKSPAANVPLPKSEAKEKVGKFLEIGQIGEMLKLFGDHELKPIIYVTLYYGLRRSEVLGLKWDAVDFENDVLEIKHTVVKGAHSIIAEDGTKNTSSKRKYSILPEIRDFLIELKNKQDKNRKLFGREYIENDYVFTWPDGRPFRPDSVTKGFQRVLKNNGFQMLRFHDLRHSCASMLYEKGWELKDIQQWLGHANIKMTGDVYTHISKLRMKILAKNLEGTFDLSAG